MRNGVAQFLKIPRENVRVVWMQGPQAYGRTAADDAGFEAAFLANELGRPVRMQWTRQEETGVGHQGPRLRDQDARRARCEGQARRARLRRARRRLQSCRLQRARHGADRAADGHAQAPTLARTRVVPVGQVRDSESPQAGSVVPMPLAWETPIRMGNLRDPDGPQVTFASESFIDELAAAAKADPVAFRLALLEASTETTAASSARDRSRASRRRRRSSAGSRARRRTRAAAPATSSPAAASPTRIAARPWSPRSSKSKSTAGPGASGSSASVTRTTAAW